MMLNVKTLWERYKFSPLYYEDGRPCYVRIGCLSACACCLLLSVALKDNSPSADMGQSAEAGSSLLASSSAVGANGVILSSDAQSDPARTLQHGAAAMDVVQTAAAVSTQETAQEGVLSLAAIDANSAKEEADTASLDVDTDEDSWSLWDFLTGESKKKKALLTHRKQAIEELVNGAAFLTSCGNINAGYIGCRFDFSSKVSDYFDSKIEAADDGFVITLEAKGDQLEDSCARFVVNSEGLYQAFDANGFVRQKCLVNSGLGEQMVALHRAIDGAQGNPAPSGARLAQK